MPEPTVHPSPKPVCPQRDSNPRYSLERAVTWAASRWGPARQCRGASGAGLPAPTLARGPVAQLAEQGTFNPKVVGSNPTRPTREIPANADVQSPPSSSAISGGSTGSARIHQTGKAPSIFAAWRFRSARSQWP